MRIVSLLPSATEIVADLGLAGDLVGRSHECQCPEEVRAVPVVSASRIDSAALGGRQIDEAVRVAVDKGEALYAVDGELLASLRPEVIITQDLCRVCAVSGGDLGEVGARVKMWLDVNFLDTAPTHLGDKVELPSGMNRPHR